MTKPVVVRYTRDVAAVAGERGAQFKGAEYAVSSLADAKRFHPDAQVIGYEGANGQIEPIEKAAAEKAEPETGKG